MLKIMTVTRFFHLLFCLALQAALVVVFAVLLTWLPTSVYWLDLLVFSAILWLWIYVTLPPWVNLKDRSQKQVGSLGARWYAAIAYTLSAGAVAVAGMIGTSGYIEADVQWVIQSILLVLLGGALIMAASMGAKVEEVYHREAALQAGVEAMASSTRRLADAVATADGVPPAVAAAVRELEEEVRFLSPSDSPEARRLEHDYLQSVDVVVHALGDPEMNATMIEKGVRNAALIAGRRKKVYSE